MGLLSFFTDRAPRLQTPVERTEPTFGGAVVRSGSTGNFASASYPSYISAGLGAMPSATGLPVTPFTALAATAVFSCVRCLAEDWAKIPLVVQQRRPGGRGWDTLHEHYLARLLRRPNRWQTPYQFWSFVSTCLSMRGNSYVVIVRGDNGQPRSLVPVSPDRMSLMLSPSGWLFYHVSHANLGDGLTLHQDDVLHWRGFSLDGYQGISPIMASPEAIGLAMASQRHGATLFRQGAQLQGVLTAAKTLSKEAAARLGQSWRETYGGVDNTGKTAILEDGMRYEKIGMTSQESQFLETRQHQDTDICGMFRVPPHKIGRLDDAHFANIEAMNQSYIDDGLLPNIRQTEEMLPEKLLFEDERDMIRVRAKFDEMLRGDLKTRTDAGVQAVNNGLKSRNEWRADEGLNPYPGGDEFLQALNLGKPGQTSTQGETTPAPSQPTPAGA